VVRVMSRSGEVVAHEFCVEVAGMKTRKDSLFAVSPELQLKFQNSEVTVTNWDRVRWFEGPTIHSIRAIAPSQMTKNSFQLSAVTFQLSSCFEGVLADR